MNSAFLEGLALLETAGGKKTIKGPEGQDSFNLYNIKDFTGKGFRVPDKAEGSRDAYRVYASADESKQDLLGLLGRKYPKALEAKTPEEFATALKAGGYSTDPAYVTKLAGAIHSVLRKGEGTEAAAGPVAASEGPVDITALRAATRAPTAPQSAPAGKLNRLQEDAAVQAELAFPGKGAAQAVANPEQAQAWHLQASPVPVPSATQDPMAGAFKAAAEQAVEQARKDNTPLMDVYGASWLEGVTGAALRHFARPEYEPVPGFQVPEELYVGKTAEQQQQLQEVASPGELNRLQFEWDENKKRLDDMSARGVGPALGLGLLAGIGDPASMLAGAGLAASVVKLGVGSQALMKAGRGGAAVASSLAENVGANIGLEAVRQGLGGQGDLTDFAAAGAFGMIPGVLTGASALGQAGRVAAANELATLAAKAAEQEAGYINRARATLGEGATDEQLAAEIAKQKLSDRKAVVEDSVTRVADDRQIFPVDEDPDTSKLKQADDEVARQEAEVKAKEAEDAAPVVAPKEGEPEVVVIDRMPDDEFDKLFVKAKDEVQASPAPVMRAQRLDEGGTITDQLAQTTARKMLTFLVKASDPMIARLAQRLLPIFQKSDVPVHILADDTIPGQTRGDRSHYDEAHNRIVLGQKAAGNQGIQLHEIAHAALVYKTRYGLHKTDSAIGKIVTQIESIRRNAEREYRAATYAGRIEKNSNTEYYLKNIDEFLAGLFSGQQEAGHFLTHLASIKDTKGPSLLSEFARMVRGILGLEVQDMNALLRSMDLTDSLIKEALTTELLPSPKGLPGMRVVQAPPNSMTAAQLQANPLAKELGLDLLPMSTIGEQADARVMLHMHRKAADWAAANPKDAAWDKRVKTLTDNRIFSVDSTALIMLKSNNDLVRYIATELLEDASGASGIRQSTASISKYMHERLFMGNVVNDLQDVYAIYRKNNGGSIGEDALGGKTWDRFNREVAEEIEARGQGQRTRNPGAEVSRAADVMQAGFERMRKAQVANKTPGWGSLPETSVGYLPHKMNHQKVRDMTNAQRKVLHTTLVEQFITIEGWDTGFSHQLAGKYLDRIRARAVGGYDGIIGINQTGAADIVQDALTAMGLSKAEVQARMASYMRAGPGHTKRRIKLDLNRIHKTDGEEFRLLDLFDTDMIRLMRGQAQRVSGEAALMRHGIPGKGGLDMIRKAMEFGKAGQTTAIREFEAFDQVAAEFLGMPFGTESGKWMDRARQMTAVTKLGGIVFNQFAEYINAVVHVGVGRTLSAVGGIARLRSEVIALAKGQQVDNPIIGSIEHTTGAEFGTDPYKLVFPFDDVDNARATYGRDTLGATDRLLRGAGHLQSKLSFWRAMHAAQQRGMAEQIVRKAARFLRDGNSDTALEDMGITASLQAKLRLSGDMDYAAQWNGNDLVSFDVTKIRDKEAAEEFIQAVYRGTNQIIQGTFIGEQGKWAHDGLMKTLTQFRTFSLTSMEKQWARQRNSRGTGAAAGILLGSMSMAAPIYMARVYANSIGRPDQEAYLEAQLTPFQIARATLNYVALSGLAGDFIDGLVAAVPGMGEVTGGRTGANTGAVGNLIAPSAGLVDDIFQVLQAIDDPHKATQLLPGSRLPYLIPALNLTRD